MDEVSSAPVRSIYLMNPSRLPAGMIKALKGTLSEAGELDDVLRAVRLTWRER